MEGNYDNIHDKDLLYAEKIICDRKVFFLDLKQNARGRFVKITEAVKNRRDTILVPSEALPEIIEALQAIAAHDKENEPTEELD